MFNLARLVWPRRSPWLLYSTLALIACGCGMVLSQLLTTEVAIAQPPTPDYVWPLPDWAPRPQVPADNPMTTAKVELGR
ncbi:MAG: hypothetical protein HC910_23005, partial [Spirulinaceae cyanobacterium SM2_1_0]|nr:hypothetical protein [Spirulinaceae cyanobacterium SM2_1_0]